MAFMETLPAKVTKTEMQKGTGRLRFSQVVPYKGLIESAVCEVFCIWREKLKAMANAISCFNIDERKLVRPSSSASTETSSLCLTSY